MLPDHYVRQRDFLLEISRAITAQLDLTEVLRRVLNASVVMLNGQVGLIALREADGVYHIRATLGLEREIVPQLSQQLQELITAMGDNDLDSLNAKFIEMAVAVDKRLRQPIPLPLIIAGEAVGLLIVFRTHPFTVTPNDIQVLQSFADQAAIAVNNAQLYERIDHDRRRLAAILQHSADGVMILDAHLQIQSFNRALERMTGWKASEAVGKHQDEVIAWKKLDKSNLREALAEGWPFRNASDHASDTLYVEGDMQRPDGLTVSVGITYAPLLTASGKLTNIIANVRDITNFRKAQEMQNIFISGISHELKTPVALIKGYAGTLRREDATWDPVIIMNSLGVIEEEADRLTELIQNLLEASKLQAQQLHLDLGDVQLEQLAVRSLERLKTQSKNHKFVLDFPTDFPVTQGDEARLRQVLDNLISNAIKYSPQGGEITVGGRANDQNIMIFVRDQGVGMTENEQERIFERFYRVDSALSRKTQGTGLGLYLAKEIVEAHNGTLQVESQPGQGSTFYFTIPRK
jgi:PAS domain S-box-containing protein